MHRYHVKRERRHRRSDHPRGVDRCSGCRGQNLSLLDGPSFLAILEIQMHKYTRAYEPTIEPVTAGASASCVSQTCTTSRYATQTSDGGSTCLSDAHQHAAAQTIHKTAADQEEAPR
jgi:hypothetical protein